MTETLITNPGIADRVEQDVGGFHQFGFSFERYNAAAKPSSSSSVCGILRSTFTPCSDISSTANIEENGRDNPYHLWVDIPSSSLVPTVGPFIRTFVRITDGLDPNSLRVIINFDWSECNDTKTEEEEDERENTAAAKIAHHVHILVRNSMGAALFLTSLSIHLPQNISIDKVRKAMNENEHVNYPSIGLVEKGRDDEDRCCKVPFKCSNEGKRCPPVSVQKYLQCGNDGKISSARIKVETRMCTVRATPVLYHLSKALRNEDNLLSADIDSAVAQAQTKLPRILACVDKPANLFRIIMLARDYNAQNKLVIVVRDERIRSRLASETSKFVAGLDSDKCTNNSIPRVLTIDDTIAMLNSECCDGLVAVDLHEDALTLDEENADKGKSALITLRNAAAVIWGFEKDGIPQNIDEIATAYVLVRTRTSLNLVAAMSVVLHRGWSEAIQDRNILIS